MGSIYRRKDSRFWWISYCKDGLQYSESSRSQNKEIASQMLRLREGEIAQGKMPAVIYERVRFDELAEDLLIDYRINNRKSMERIELSIKALKKDFGGVKAPRINTAMVKSYIDRRMREGMSNATINRELAALKRAFRLAAQCTPPKVGMVPYIPMLKENNVRKGFFEKEDFLKLRAALPFYLRPVLNFAYRYGWRKSEILNLTWDKVNFDTHTVRLDPGETKSGEARTIVLNKECLEDIHSLYASRKSGYVFHRRGQRILDFRTAWPKACEKVGLGRRLFHDLRRTAVRNLIRSGGPERVAMQITGHKTRAVFDRYNIVNEDDIRKAVERLDLFYGSTTVPQNRALAIV